MHMPNHILGYGFYPERLEAKESWLDRMARRPALWVERQRTRKGADRFASFVKSVNDAGSALQGASPQQLKDAASALRPDLKRKGMTDETIARSFAVVRETSARVLGQRHYDVQLIGGWILLGGRVAEMETGEGKTLTATLAAATAALSGMPTHIVTVNDYLAARDAADMRPLYEALGLTVGCVTSQVEGDARAAAYRCDVVYCTNKDLAFDYLRDRMQLRGRPRPLRHAVDRICGGTSDALIMRGLHFAIVDEVDGVLVDEARTPLILSREVNDESLARLHTEALTLARALVPGEDFFADKAVGRVGITESGKAKLAELAEPMGGMWSGPNRREEFVLQALRALHLYQRDTHYLVREGEVQIIDEYTGRVMEDRKWERGLHQMIEVKENCEISGQRETIARISFQRFFRRYVKLAGMTGTAREIETELWDVYRLRVTRVPTRAPVMRHHFPTQVFEFAEEKWLAVLEAVKREHAKGRPILIGTRSVGASEIVSRVLTEAGLAHRLLNARQDKEEADIVAQGGQLGAITVATNMAGRGTDIKLTDEARAAGGLHVIATELHESGRIDRQLFGRCSRQGDPGSCEAIVCLEDELIDKWGQTPFFRGSANTRSATLFKSAQQRAERFHARARKEVLAMDDYLGDLLAFAGRGE